jgi:probable O-glycosylation ligase (exosortase A-associated)
VSKQFLFMVAMTLAGTVGVYAVDAFWGVAVYYLFAVLRPQYLWEWSLPAGVSWSFYVALATMGAGLAVALGILSPGKAAEGSPRPRLTLAHLCVLAFGAWVCLTYFTAQNKDAAYPWLFEYAKIMVMFAVATALTRTVGQLWALLLLTGSALAYIGYEVNFLYVFHHYLGIQRNGYGGLDNNGAGLMLAMGVPLCWFISQGMAKWWRWLFVLLIPVLVHAVLMTYSRGAMVSLLLVCPLVWLRSRGRLLLCLFGVLMGLVLVPTMAGPEIRARFLTLKETEADASANSRRDSWKAALRIAADYPIVGVGIRNANLYSHRYGADYEGRTIHSTYLQVAADNGFVGLGLLVLMLSGGWLGAWRSRRAVKGRDDPEARRIAALASGVECSLCVFGVGSAFLSLEVFELPYLLIFIGAQLSVLSGAAAGRTVPAAPEDAPADEGDDPFGASAHTLYDDHECPDHAVL